MPSKPLADPTAIPVILLAAGASTRLGQPKQLLRLPAFGGETLLDHAVALAREAGAAPIFVVLGAHAEEIILECELLDCILVRNEAWSEGMASSLRVGVTAVLENAPAASGAMVLVCDQPGLSAEHLGRLLDAHREHRHRIAASRYAGRTGVPAIFPRVLFPALLELQGDQGARALLQQSGAAIHAIDFPGGELDLDSPEDLQRLQVDVSTRPPAKTS
ncbi:MAG TPA: nucleotidyltransferase family protein [Acidobacteriaceae bacterium]|nr:nucleotidyltransferase family protein [Acidobacteriaceae bacterium]